MLAFEPTRTKRRVSVPLVQKPTQQFKVLERDSDTAMSILELVRQYDQGQVKSPPHQREFVWSAEKRKAWAETLIGCASGRLNSPPIGLITTYQLVETGDYFLNDGYQRLRATKEFLEKCGQYKLTLEQAEQVCKAYKVMVSHRQYEDHTEAMYWFQMLQLGTSLTSYDFCQGYLIYFDTEVNWLPFLTDMHEFMDGIMTEYANRLVPLTLGSIHTGKRHNYALFLRWLNYNKSATPNHASIATKVLNMRDADNKRMVEQRLAGAFGELGENRMEKALEEWRAFKRFITAEAETIRKVYLEVRTQGKPSYTMLRWLLSIAIWRRNNGLNTDGWETFVRLMFQNTDSANHIVVLHDDGSTTYKILGLDKSGELRSVCQMIGFPAYIRVLDDYNTKKRK